MCDVVCVCCGYLCVTYFVSVYSVIGICSTSVVVCVTGVWHVSCVCVLVYNVRVWFTGHV